MPLDWSSIFGDEKVTISKQDEPRLLDGSDTEGVIKQSLSEENEDLEGRIFLSVNQVVPRLGSDGRTGLPLLADNCTDWGVFTRNDSVASQQETEGVFPSIIMNEAFGDRIRSPATTQCLHLSAAHSPRVNLPTTARGPLGRSGLPPPAPRSPPTLAFSRRQGRPVPTLNNTSTLVVGVGKSTVVVVGSGKIGGAGTPEDCVVAAAAGPPRKGSWGVGEGVQNVDVSYISGGGAVEISDTDNSILTEQEFVDTEEASGVITAPPSSSSSLCSTFCCNRSPTADSAGNASSTTITVLDADKDTTVPEEEDDDSSNEMNKEHGQLRQAPHYPRKIINPLSQSQLAPFSVKPSAHHRRMSSTGLRSSVGWVGDSPDNGGAPLKASAMDGSRDQAAAPPKVSATGGLLPTLEGPNSTQARAALGHPWSSTTTRCTAATTMSSCAVDEVRREGQGDAMDRSAAVVGNVSRQQKLGLGMNEDDESRSITRDSSQRGSSYRLSARRLSAKNLRGYLSRWSSSQQAKGQQPDGSVHASFRVMGSTSSKSSSPSRGGIMKHRKRSFTRRHSHESAVVPPPQAAVDQAQSFVGGAAKAYDPQELTRRKSSPEPTRRGLAPEKEDSANSPEEKDESRESGDYGVEELEVVPEEEPVAILAESVKMKGMLVCGRAMRMDGIFEGELFSTGSITIGPTGSVIGNLKGLDFLRVEGEVVGDILCNTVMVLNGGKVLGDITAVNLTVGPKTTVRGMLNVVDDAGSIIDTARQQNASAAANSSKAEEEKADGESGRAHGSREVGDGSVEHGDAGNTTMEEDSDEERLSMYQHASKDSVGTASETDAASDHDGSSDTLPSKAESSTMKMATSKGKLKERRVHVLREAYSSGGSGVDVM